MLTLILEVIDRAIKLLQSRADTNRRHFDDHIEPVFQELERIHVDYMALASEIFDYLQSSEEPAEILDRVGRRVELLPVRQRVIALESAIRGARAIPAVSTQFFETVAAYFSLAAGPRGRSTQHDDFSVVTPATTLLMALEILQENPTDDWIRESVAREVILIRTSIEDRWNDMLGAYARARIELLK